MTGASISAVDADADAEDEAEAPGAAGVEVELSDDDAALSPMALPLAKPNKSMAQELGQVEV